MLEKIKELSTDIKNKKFSPFYFIYGEEFYFIDTIISKIKQAFDDKMSLNTKSFDNFSFNVDDAIKCIISMPFMSEKKLVVFKDIDLFNSNETVNKNDKEKIIEAFEKSKDTNIVIIVMHNTTKKYEDMYNKNNLIFDYVKNNGVVLNSKKLYENDIAKYISSYFTKKDKAINKLQILNIIKKAGRDLTNLFNECDKIINFVGEKKVISDNDINACVSRSIEDSVFKLFDLINSGKRSEAINVFMELRNGDLTSQALIKLMINNYKNLLIVKSMLEKSKSVKDIINETGLYDFQVKKYVDACKTVTLESIIAKLKRIEDVSIMLMHSDVNADVVSELVL